MNALEHKVDHLGSIATRRQLVARGSQVMFEWDFVERTVLAALVAHP